MNIKDLGYSSKIESFRVEQKLEDFEIGRVVAEYKERYTVKTIKGEFDAEITGNMRFTAKSREDFPAVGDWVALLAYDNNFVIIHSILPRSSVIKRRAVGHFGDIQVIAANIDYALLVQAVDRDYSINRLERYLTICNSSRVSPIIILTKTDLIEPLRLDEIINSLKLRVKNVPVIAISNTTQNGYDVIGKMFEKGKTYCMLGSSGVGKSTLLNNLLGKDIMKTGEISQSIQRGKHVTSHRELIVLENGSVLIDNPGMREVGIADSARGLELTFDEIFQLSKSCKFIDCTHTREVGCAVIDAVNKGEFDMASYENYLKMEREKSHFESTIAQKRRKEKAFGKMLKNYKKNVTKNKS